MPQVFFYHGAEDKLLAACRLLQGAYRQNKPMMVLVPNDEEAQQLDRLLWTQPALSFVPHCRADASVATETPILLAGQADRLPNSERLMNLGPDAPSGLERFEKLIEVVGQDDADRQAARQRVHHYKQLGYPIQYFNLAEQANG